MDKSTYEVRLAQWTGLVKLASERPRGVMLKDWLDDKIVRWLIASRASGYIF